MRVSYSKRNFVSDYAAVNPSYTITRPYETMGREEKVVNNRIVKTSCWKVFDPVESKKGIDASLFSLDNIIAAGATEMLRPCNVNLNSGLEMCDVADVQMNNIIDAINNEQNTEE